MQYLPGRHNQTKIGPQAEKQLLTFNHLVARWGKKDNPQADDKANNPDPVGKENWLYKDVEAGTHGHYDFLYRNTSEQDLEIVSYASSCDCTSVKACAIPAAEWDRLALAQEKSPGEPLKYSQEPTWGELPKQPGVEIPSNRPEVILKPNGTGVIRVGYNATKAPGQSVNVYPTILFRTVTPSVGRVQAQGLAVPVKVRSPLQFEPLRVSMGVLSTGKPVSKKFIAWSATRKAIDFTLGPPGAPDPLFSVQSRPISGREFEELQADFAKKKIADTMLCAFEVTLTVHESKGTHQLELGSFYRRWPFGLDGQPPDPNSPLWGPEIVGRTVGEVEVGGFDDQGKIRFPSFSAATGATAEVQLATAAKIKLEKVEQHRDQPSWIKVELSRDEQQASKSRTTWQLEVTVPGRAIGARSFEEPDAVVLRIAGTDRLVRIPLEGHISR
jgi:hypothetical protein